MHILDLTPRALTGAWCLSVSHFILKMTVYRNVILTVRMEEADNSLAEMDSPYLYLTVSSLINSPGEDTWCCHTVAGAFSAIPLDGRGERCLVPLSLALSDVAAGRQKKLLLASSSSQMCIFSYKFSWSRPPWGRRGFKPRIRPPYPQRVVKGD